MRVGILLLALFVLAITPRVGAVVSQIAPEAGSLFAQASSAVFPGRTPETSMAQVVQPYEVVLTPQNNGAISSAVDQTKETASRVWSLLVPLSVFVSLLFFMGAAYSYIRVRQVRMLSSGKYNQFDSRTKEASAVPSKSARKWEVIVEHANSENENDWRQAIMEADIMLDELLEVQGYRGDTMGEKMKQIERSDFLTIDMAWDAHKVRNRIAHEGSDMQLNHREVRRVISLYEKVFKEFHVI